MLTKNCAYCGMTYHKRNDYETRLSRFCSKACCDAYQRNRPLGPRMPPKLVTCEQCGLEFAVYPSRSQTKYCSLECHHAAQHNPITLICQGCGDEFTVTWARRYRKFCSHDCYLSNLELDKNPHWKGGRPNYYGPNWTKQAAKARKRDGYKCCICGLHQQDCYRLLDVHHITPFKDFGLEQYKVANKLDNLITLCSPCHIGVESGTIALPSPLSAS